MDNQRFGFTFNISKDKHYYFDTGTGKTIACSPKERALIDRVLNNVISIETAFSENPEFESFVKEERLFSDKQWSFFLPTKEEVADLVKGNCEQIVLELTESCNLRCKYCIYNEHHPNHRDFSSKKMNFTIAKRSIDNILSNFKGSRFALTFYGGEPLLNFDLMKKCIIYVRDNYKHISDLSYGFTTNLTFPANVFLLNPPYSAPGKGLIFVDEALSRMETGYGAVLIQENAGSGQGDVYAKRILEKNTLVASVHMPIELFSGKSSVQTAIYLFKVNRPHEEDDVVTFIDFSEDGYSRQNRKKSTQKVNLRNTDHALERYDEVAAICLGKKSKTDYYTESNGLVMRDTVSLNGDDWTFNQHKKIDITPTEEDFKKMVADYLAWKVAAILKGEVSV